MKTFIRDILVLILLIAVGAVIFFYQSQTRQVHESIQYSGTDQSIAGTLYMSALPVNYPINQEVPYALDLSNHSLSRGDLQDDQRTELHAVSKNGSLVAFVGTTGDYFRANGSDLNRALQIYIASSTPDTLLPRIDENARRVSTTFGQEKRELSLSDAGALLYVALNPDERDKVSDLRTAESWWIYLVGANGNETHIAEGIDPKWVDENHFVFLKNDGIYLFTLSTRSEARVWGMRGTAISNMHLAISPDNKYIAWSAPDAGQVTVIEVQSLDTPKLVLHGLIKAHGFWVLFSPDSKHIALQAVDWATIATNPHSRIEFYDVDTLTKSNLTAGLENFDQQDTFVTSWN